MTIQNRPARTIELILSSALIILAVFGNLLWFRAELANHAARLERTERDVRSLEEFASTTNSNRFTANEGRTLEERVHRLELWTTQAPPLWFREIFKEFKSDMRAEIGDLRTEISALKATMLLIQRLPQETAEDP